MYFIIKKVLENAWLVMSGVFIPRVTSYTSTYVEMNVITNFETKGVWYIHIVIVFV